MDKNYNEDDHLLDSLNDAYKLFQDDIKEELVTNIGNAIRTVLKFYNVEYNAFVKKSKSQGINEGQINVTIKRKNELTQEEKIENAITKDLQGLCICENEGEDDGVITCRIHHDCSDGSCTHQDGED